MAVVCWVCSGGFFSFSFSITILCANIGFLYLRCFVWLRGWRVQKSNHSWGFLGVSQLLLLAVWCHGVSNGAGTIKTHALELALLCYHAVHVWQVAVVFHEFLPALPSSTLSPPSCSNEGKKLCYPYCEIWSHPLLVIEDSKSPACPQEISWSVVSYSEAVNHYWC